MKIRPCVARHAPLQLLVDGTISILQTSSPSPRPEMMIHRKARYIEATYKLSPSLHSFLSFNLSAGCVLLARFTFSSDLAAPLQRCLEERRSATQGKDGEERSQRESRPRRENAENSTWPGTSRRTTKGACTGTSDSSSPLLLLFTRSYVRLFPPLSIYFLSLSSFPSNLHSRRYGLSRTSLLVSPRELPL